MKSTLLLTGLLLTLAIPAQALTIAAWTDANATGSRTATTVDAGVSSAVLSRAAGLNAAGSSSYNSNGWSTGTTKTGAVTANDYLSFGFSGTTAYDLTALSVGFTRNGNGPTSMAIDLFAGSTFVAQVYTTAAVSTGSAGNAVVDLSAYDNMTNVSFRLYGWNARNNNGTFSIDNRAAFAGNAIRLTGELTPPPPPPPSAVPIPATLPLLLAALGALVFGRRRT